MALTTATALKANYLSISDSNHDTKLTALISQATAIMESICFQPLDQVATVIQFAGDGTTSRLLSYTVPISLTSLGYKQLPTDASWTALTGAVIYEENGAQRLYYSQGLSYPYYRIAADVGYSSAPNDLVNICSEMVLELWHNTDFAGGENRFGLSSIASSEGGITSTTAYRDLMDRYKEKLKKYKRVTW